MAIIKTSCLCPHLYKEVFSGHLIDTIHMCFQALWRVYFYLKQISSLSKIQFLEIINIILFVLIIIIVPLKIEELVYLY